MKAPAIFACRGDSAVTATFLSRTPTPVIAGMQLVAFAAAAAALWLLHSQRMQKWDALQRWTQAVRSTQPAALSSQLVLVRTLLASDTTTYPPWHARASGCRRGSDAE